MGSVPKDIREQVCDISIKDNAFKIIPKKSIKFIPNELNLFDDYEFYKFKAMPEKHIAINHNISLIKQIVHKRLKEDEISISECMKEYAEFMVQEAMSKVEIYKRYESNRT